PGLRRLERSDECLLHPVREAVVRHSDGVASADPVSVGDSASRPSRGGLSVFAKSASPPRYGRDDPLGNVFDVWTKNLKEFFVVFFVLALVNGLLGGLVALAILGTFGPSTGFFPGGPPSGIPASALGNLLLFAIISILAGAILSSIVGGGMTEYAVRRFRGESITL